MSDGYPSLTALLGLLAVAGFQNRDKIAEMLSGLTGAGQPSPPAGTNPTSVPSSSGPGGFLSGAQSAGDVGGFLGGGLSELVNRFQQAGHAETVNSWVNTGPNRPIAPPQLEQAIGPDVMNALAQRTGLSREELLNRLSRELPSAVDRYTPDGRLPSPA